MPSATQSKTRTAKVLTKWDAYKATVRARSDLTSGAKECFDALARYATYKLGENRGALGTNCAPEIDDLVKELGRSRQSIARHIRQLRAHGIVETIPLRTPSGRWNRNGYHFVEFESAAEFGNFTWLKPSRTARHPVARAHDQATGRFVSTMYGEKVPHGYGEKVPHGDRNVWSQSDQPDLAVDSDIALDLAPSPAAPAPALSELETKTPTPEIKTTDVDRKAAGVLDSWWESQLNEPRRAYAGGDYV